MDRTTIDKAIISGLRTFQIFVVGILLWLIGTLVVQGVRLHETEAALKRSNCAEAPPR